MDRLEQLEVRVITGTRWNHGTATKPVSRAVTERVVIGCDLSTSRSLLHMAYHKLYRVGTLSSGLPTLA